MKQTKSDLLQSLYLNLTTTGRKTRKLHTVELSFYSDGNKIYLLAHKRDTGNLTDWAENLKVNPNCKIQIGKEEFLGTFEFGEDGDKLEDFVRKNFENKYGISYYNIWYHGTNRMPITISL